MNKTKNHLIFISFGKKFSSYCPGYLSCISCSSLVLGFQHMEMDLLSWNSVFVNICVITHIHFWFDYKVYSQFSEYILKDLCCVFMYIELSIYFHFHKHTQFRLFILYIRQFLLRSGYTHFHYLGALFYICECAHACVYTHIVIILIYSWIFICQLITSPWLEICSLNVGMICPWKSGNILTIHEIVSLKSS